MKDIVKEAEAVILSLEKNRKNEFALRTNQLRKFLSAVNTVSNKVNVYQAQIVSANPSRMSKDLVLSEQLAAEIKYLKVKIAYQAGRERAVRDFVQKAELTKKIDEIGTDLSKYKEFAKYIEALVAYHKFYGGKD
ncbi:type III-A CRISPR-associated protein Csm2 [Megasphaera stantonii]|jgi:CRISPR-associated protein Csm2|uniref:type III-A CRISPR-associated protein Csm2 n=1 Tax=Megasphaera stantonii TaxID=2144175 RepID=UPI00320A9947